MRYVTFPKPIKFKRVNLYSKNKIVTMRIKKKNQDNLSYYELPKIKLCHWIFEMFFYKISNIKKTKI